MKPYVHVEKNFASLDECNYIINHFGPKCKEHLYGNGPLKGQTFPYLGYFFNEDEILQCLPNFGVRVQSLIQIYEKKHPEVKFAPSFFTLNEVRLQRYLPGNSFGQFHFEHGYHTPYRVFNFILYLSDNNCGTEFYTGEIEKTEPGKALMFPTQFTHCHRGTPDLDGKERYIITGYFNYYDDTKAEYKES